MKWLKYNFFIMLFLVGCNQITFKVGDDSTGLKGPSSLSLITPVSSPSSVTTPTIRVNGIVSGDTVKLFTDSSCSQQVASGVSVGTSIDLMTSTLATGIFNFYANFTGIDNKTSSCSTAFLTYFLNTSAAITFSQEYYSATEGSQTVGAAIVVNRVASGITQDVTLTADAVSAGSGDLSLGTRLVSFGVSDLSVTIPLSSFGLVNNGSSTGDKVFRIKLSGPTNGGILGTRSEAFVNILDTQLAEDYFFPQSLYTVSESSSSVAITVQRKAAGAIRTVQVGFINNTAIGGVDFTATPITASFTASQTEVTVNIPITRSNTTQKDNKSFFIKLQNPQATTSARAASMAKVRILDDDEPTTNCDETITSGFGGGDGSNADPFRICSFAQLDEVRSNLDKSFRLMADLDLNSGFAPIGGPFTGSFDGDERVLKNFRHEFSGPSGTPVGFFSIIGGNATTLIKSVNFVQMRLTSNSDYAPVGGVVGQYNQLSTISNLFLSGFVKSNYNSRAGGIAALANGAPVSAFANNLITGVIEGGDGGSGGIINYVNDSSTIWLSKNYVTASIISEDVSGGLVTTLDSRSNVVFKIADSLSTGYISGGLSGRKSGGLVGVLYTDNSMNEVRMTNSSSSARLLRGSTLGGLIGSLHILDGVFEFTNLNFSGIVSSSDNAGGAIGELNFAKSGTISNITTSGSITGTGSVGGFAGTTNVWYTSNQTMVLTNLSSSASIQGPTAYTSGGLIGMLVMGRGSNHTMTLKNSTFTGSVLGNGRSAGLVGQLTVETGNHKAAVEDSTVVANITGTSQTAGAIGKVETLTNDSGILEVKNISVTGTISGGTNYTTGGVIGAVVGQNNPSNSHITLTNLSFNGNIDSDGNAGGVLGEMNVVTSASGNVIDMSLFSARGTVTGLNQTGGLVGNLICDGTGSLIMNLTRSTTSSRVNGSDRAGGFVGGVYNNGSACIMNMSDLAASGIVTGNSIAGFAGTLISNVSGATRLNNIVTTSILTGTYSEGFAHNMTNTTAVDSYWLKDPGVNNALVPDDTYQATTIFLQNPASFSGTWDFTNTWNSPSAGHYPTLKGF